MSKVLQDTINSFLVTDIQTEVTHKVQQILAKGQTLMISPAHTDTHLDLHKFNIRVWFVCKKFYHWSEELSRTNSDIERIHAFYGVPLQLDLPTSSPYHTIPQDLAFPTRIPIGLTVPAEFVIAKLRENGYFGRIGWNTAQENELTACKII